MRAHRPFLERGNPSSSAFLHTPAAGGASERARTGVSRKAGGSDFSSFPPPPPPSILSCAWDFGRPTSIAPNGAYYNLALGNNYWLIQTNWDPEGERCILSVHHEPYVPGEPEAYYPGEMAGDALWQASAALLPMKREGQLALR